MRSRARNRIQFKRIENAIQTIHNLNTADAYLEFYGDVVNTKVL